MLGNREEDWADYGMMLGGPLLALLLCTILLWVGAGWQVVAAVWGGLTFLVLITLGATVAGRKIGRVLGRTVDKRARKSKGSLTSPLSRTKV